jgi:Ser/Thr protein kinase RdoA (MazF antagonist)
MMVQDRRLLQRDRLLDPVFMARIFSDKLGPRRASNIERCQVIRVTYHPGKSLRVAYRVHAEKHQFVIACRAWPEGVDITARGGGPSRPVVCQETGSLFWIFPNDRRIAHLGLLTDPRRLASELGRQWVGCELVAYTPEKCATARCVNAQGDVSAYVKIYADARSETCSRTYLALARASAKCPDLVFPKLIGYSLQHRLLLFEPLDGPRIADLRACDTELGFRKLGVALGCLHQIAAPPHLQEFQRTQPEQLRRAAATIGFVRPELEELAASVCEQLCQTRDSSERRTFLHGDVHAKNGILLGNRVAIIDFDQAACGPPAADLGSFLAALRYERIAGDLSEPRERRLAQAFLDGYATRSQLPGTDSLRWHTAAALLAERTLRAVTRFRARGLARLPELLNEAAR